VIYVSIDLETTGLVPSEHHIIEMGAVLHLPGVPVDDLPTFRALVVRETYAVNPYCAGMHRALFAEVASKAAAFEGNSVGWEGAGRCLVDPFSLLPSFLGWLEGHGMSGKLNLAGKNILGFDIPFLAELPNFGMLDYRHRVLDPAILFVRPGDSGLPGLSLCCERAGIEVAGLHTAVADALMVVRLLRVGLGG